MPLSTTTSSAPLSPTIKMEDRKRPALGGADDIAPPSKRQAVNGGSKSSKDDSGDMKDEAWIEEYTKDAIYRQMQEYKRKVSTHETRIQEMERRSAHHDDHLRIVDAWWVQFLQELSIVADSTVPFQSGDEEQPFPTYTSFKDIEDLESHLVDKKDSIKNFAESIFARLAAARGQVAPNITNLESQVNALLAKQKELLVKVEQLSSEKDDTSEQLDQATLRYMKAERKLDRVKSTQVQKLEQQALAHATVRPSGPDQENGMGGSESNGNTEALQVQLQEVTAVADKQKEQLEEALAQNKALQEELTGAQSKLTSLTDEDYSRTELFKLFKSHQEDVIKRVNHLEAENKSLVEANRKLTEERKAYKEKLEQEAQQLTSELEDQLQQSDSNLVRIRSARDELHADVQKLKASADQERSSYGHMKDLVSAKDDRITALEAEVQRLRPNEDVDMTPRPDIENMTHEELLEKYKKLQNDYDSINMELPAMTAAVKKFQSLAVKRVMDLAAVEEKLQMAIAEKGKANQKYFEARKNSDSQAEEYKRMRSQNAKSSEIITQLKESEAQNRTLLGNLEKQLVDLKQTNTSIVAENKRMEASANEANRRFDALKTQITELNGLVKSKDTVAIQSRERTATLETENERLKLRLDHTSKERDKWKVKSMNNSSEEEDMLRKLATCSVCQNRFKDTIIKNCGHIFCKSCIDDRIANRMRKCPNCAKAFDRLDTMPVHL